MIDCWSEWVRHQWSILALFWCVGFMMGGSLGYTIWITTKDGK